ncbi:acid phosphatase 1-like isoform X2 [Ananas comosus]|uniref:Acid phosphatase 1-like isoform X2 n=1 Tax=Ananas comosus TaxID=4615 RepID=A0A6P5H6N9_ANACO|nr:acid phosphatase 1-like isoform X2 [Ananas comosus]
MAVAIWPDLIGSLGCSVGFVALVCRSWYRKAGWLCSLSEKKAIFSYKTCIRSIAARATPRFKLIWWRPFAPDSPTPIAFLARHSIAAQPRVFPLSSINYPHPPNNPPYSTMKPLLLLFLLFLPLFSIASQDPHILPRPLILELPSHGGTEPSIAGSAGGEAEEEGEESAELRRLRCSSWRFAAEANNLGPWKTVPADCAGYVREFMTGRAYKSDLEIVAQSAAAYARSVRLAGDGMDVWVFDVDETLLSNLPYYADHGYGHELFDAHEFDKWVEKSIAPAIQSSLKLYEEVRALGFKVFLLTGRSEGHRTFTVENLKKVGFQDWDRLILRGPDDRGKPATMFKSEKRREMEVDGYRILGNSGDQWSDLLGSSLSNRSFKLPNPMYYIP